MLTQQGGSLCSTMASQTAAGPDSTAGSLIASLGQIMKPGGGGQMSQQDVVQLLLKNMPQLTEYAKQGKLNETQMNQVFIPHLLYSSLSLPESYCIISIMMALCETQASSIYPCSSAFLPSTLNNNVWLQDSRRQLLRKMWHPHLPHLPPPRLVLQSIFPHRFNQFGCPVHATCGTPCKYGELCVEAQVTRG
jgi:hypothetical protein